MPLTRLREFLRLEASGGIILMVTAALALVVSNSPWADHYQRFFETEIAVTVNRAGVVKPLLLWINDGFMAIFFCWWASKSSVRFWRGSFPRASR